MTDQTVRAFRPLPARSRMLAFTIAFLLGLVAVPASAGAYVYWNTTSGEIGRAELDGTGAGNFVTATTGFTSGLARDANYVYFTQSEAGSPTFRTIGRVGVDGSNLTSSFVPGVVAQGLVRGLAVDDSHIYWTDIGRSTIGRANLDGSNANLDFITGAVEPIAVAVDDGHIYWSNSDGGTIGRANLDGTSPNQSFITGAGDPRGVAVDGGHVYWANFASQTIGRANLDGTSPNQSFISTATSPIGLDVDDSYVYWGNFNGATIGRANLDGTGVDNAFLAAAGVTEVAVAPDLEPPSLTIDSGPAGPTNNASPVFGFTAEAGATVECSIDSGVADFGPCSGAGSDSPDSPLADGSHTFRVQATDGAGNQALKTRAFSVDTTAPQTTITSGPQGSTQGASASFRFTSSEAGAGFECRLDGAGWSACAPPRSYGSLAIGSHTFTVRAIDSAGNTDLTPASRSFEVVPPPPVTTITKAPKKKIETKKKKAKVTVSFSSVPGARFSCSFDGGGFKACASPFKVSAKSKGGKGLEHTISVRATDKTGTAGKPAVVKFRVIRKKK